MEKVEVVVLNDAAVKTAKELVAGALSYFGLEVEDDYSWNVPAIRVRGSAPAVRGFSHYLQALESSTVVVE